MPLFLPKIELNGTFISMRISNNTFFCPLKKKDSINIWIPSFPNTLTTNAHIFRMTFLEKRLNLS